MEKFTKETLQAMTQEELISAVETLQLKLETLEKEKEELKHYAQIGKKYEEHLKTEVTKLVKVVEGEDSPVLKLIDRADIETLQEMEKAYREKAQEELKPSSKQASDQRKRLPLRSSRACPMRSFSSSKKTL
jgi:catalase